MLGYGAKLRGKYYVYSNLCCPTKNAIYPFVNLNPFENELWFQSMINSKMFMFGWKTMRYQSMSIGTFTQWEMIWKCLYMAFEINMPYCVWNV